MPASDGRLGRKPHEREDARWPVQRREGEDKCQRFVLPKLDGNVAASARIGELCLRWGSDDIDSARASDPFSTPSPSLQLDALDARRKCKRVRREDIVPDGDGMTPSDQV